jgi:hypothetical protein
MKQGTGKAKPKPDKQTPKKAAIFGLFLMRSTALVFMFFNPTMMFSLSIISLGEFLF